MELLYFFISGLIIFGMGLILYYPYYTKKKKKPEIGIERENKLDYLGDGFKLLFYQRNIGIMLLGVLIMFISIILLFIKLLA